MIKKYKEFLRENTSGDIPDEELADYFLRLKEVLGCFVDFASLDTYYVVQVYDIKKSNSILVDEEIGEIKKRIEIGGDMKMDCERIEYVVKPDDVEVENYFYQISIYNLKN
jgi:hypothetical protein